MNLKTTTNKAPLAGWLWENSLSIPYGSIFCPFSSSGAVARLFKEVGKEVVTTDVLMTYSKTARALIENDETILDAFDEESIIAPSDRAVQRLEGMAGAYKLPPEFGAWLDVCYANIEQIDHDYKKALASAVIALVINYVAAFDEPVRQNMPEDEWISAYHYYLTSVNGNVFSNGKTCLAHDSDANSLVGSIETDAMSFYLPSAQGVADLRPAERFSELFNRYCFEKELDATLANLVTGLGAPVSSPEEYSAALDKFLSSAVGIPIWFICANDSSFIKPDEIQAVVSKYKKNVRYLNKQMVYSKQLSRTEYLFIGQA